MRLKLLFFLLYIGFLTVNAQTFKGRVTSEAGEPIPAVSVYIQELTSGFITDDAGYFEITLPMGSYTCEVSSMGYIRQVISIRVPSWGLEKNITLTATHRAVSARQGENQEFKSEHKTKESVVDFMNQTLFVGRTLLTRNQKAWLTLGSLSSFIPEFNAVDGLWVGAKLKTGLMLNEKTTLNFIPEVYYTSSRRDVVWRGELSLNYAPERRGYLYLKAGSISADFNGESGESRLINGASSLWFGKNDMKFYDSFYINVGNDFALSRASFLSLDAFFERASTLKNALSKGWFGVKVKPNIPQNDAYEEVFENGFLKLSASLKYAPRSLCPAFTVLYQQGFTRKALEDASPSYHRTEVTIDQRIDLGLFNAFSWRVNVGAFWNVKEMRFPDFKHFAATRVLVTEHSLDKNFSLLDNYIYSTNKRWAQVNLSWYASYLLLKQLPFLEDMKFDEALHLRALAVYDKKMYTEVGYSLGLSSLARIGVFASFERLKYKSVGVTLSFPILNMVGQ